MKVAAADNPVRASWLAEQGSRLDARPYVSTTYAARRYLNELPHTEPLSQVTECIFHPGRFRRQWAIDRKYGVPFLGSADIFEADLSNLPMITKKSFDADSKLRLRPGWTLITCSGMTAGRVTYARLSMDGHASSQDVMRVVANGDRIPAGYLYTFLASRFGIPVIKGGIYGTSVRHIEPEHIADLPVPRLGAAEKQIDELIGRVLRLRQSYEEGVVAATRDLFDRAGLAELLDLRWNDLPRELAFSAGPTASTLRALNFSPRTRRILDSLTAVPHRTLGDLCLNGTLARGDRFRRIDAERGAGVKLIGQRQGFWIRPEGRRIVLKSDEKGAVQVPDETIVVASRGTLGESEVYCRAMFVTGRWLSWGYSEDFLRVISGDPEFPGAYLFAFFRSEVAFRLLRSMSVGSKQQDLHPILRASLPVPECTAADRQRIAETVRAAYRDRDAADQLEDEAFAVLDEAVREAAG